ncbi:potassium uptake protein TrkA [Parvularcula bermudensis HTCC2503]|uniref:Trk system potassium uptake protein TrkA n=1 Tax=Parvularcula bermudensis (strain ATCC BAA-594 / HTCC2503 / KCTC 12087) TaxID=314260 RepID=E0TDY3_PARBH|nr:Trk system potassium transporter TrkA [Parvularcula bermudensis]ADM10432.1 potassium uptake protein TrkA [Parvularcula bermudensis HTCC2503]
MRAIVCGAGRVGYGIAQRLAQEKANVTVIDRSAKLIQQVSERLDVRGVVGSGSYPDVLGEAGAQEADMVIAVTASDEVNIVSCQIAHSLFSIPTKIARIRAQSYLETQYADVFSRDNIPIDVIISPEREVADAVLQRLTTPGAFDIKSFSDGRVWALGLRLGEDCPILETPIDQVRELFPDLMMTVVAVDRGGSLFCASGDDQLQAGDSVYIVCARDNVDRVISILGQEESQARRVIIIGGGNIGFDVARNLERLGQVKIRLIEREQERASQIADRLSRTIVLQGDGLDREILREAGVSNAETVVSVTNSDQTNLLASIVAKREGARRANILINEAAYGPLAHSVGIDRVIDPRSITISTILQHVRRGRIKSVYSVFEGQGELIEAVALETSNLVGIPLREAALPRGVVIGAIERAAKILLPDPTTVIQPGDRVILFAMRDTVAAVEKMFRVGIEYF